MKNKKAILSLGFILAEAILYVLILTQGGTLLSLAQFASILLCAVYTATVKGKTKKLLPIAMVLTTCADFCLVLFSPPRRLAGMVFFLGVQAVYAFVLHKQNPSRSLLWCRIGLSAVALAITGLVLGRSTDALALISLCYYANLVFNLGVSCFHVKKNALFPLGLLLFLLCDTVIGLQVASDGYLNIGTESILYRILFAPINLAWLFYLPSQVLISLNDKEIRIKKHWD